MYSGSSSCEVILLETGVVIALPLLQQNIITPTKLSEMIRRRESHEVIYLWGASGQ